MMTDEPRTEELAAQTPAEALAALIQSADDYEATARASHVWDEGGSTETVICGIQQYRAAARDELREALIPLASRMADHLFHPEDHDPKDECWIDLYRTIVGMDGPNAEPLADKGSREAGR